jgi:hypothetical protein
MYTVLSFHNFFNSLFKIVIVRESPTRFDLRPFSIHPLNTKFMNWNSVIGTATRLLTGLPKNNGVGFPAEVTYLFVHQIVRIGSGPNRPRICCVAGALSAQVKRPWREADILPQPSTEFKNYPTT